LWCTARFPDSLWVMGDREFARFVAEVRPRLARAFVAAYGLERGQDVALSPDGTTVALLTTNIFDSPSVDVSNFDDPNSQVVVIDLATGARRTLDAHGVVL
jgi:hypothetical protein